MFDDRRVDEYLWGITRVVAGGFFVPHGLQKVFNLLGSPGRAALASMFENKAGLMPGSRFVLVIGSVELLAGTALALGLLTRTSALAAAAVLLGAIVLVNRASGYFWTKGGVEYPLMWLALCLCFVVRGGGPYSLDRYLRSFRGQMTR